MHIAIPLLDMPPGIFKMINGSKFMRYHQTVPQEHLDGRVHDIPQGNVLGGGSSVNAQVYMRGRPSDYEEWHELLRGDNDYPGWGWDDVLPHFRGMEGNNRLQNDLHGSDGPLLVSDPGHINEVSRWFVQSVQALGLPYQSRLQRPEPARRRLLPVHEPATANAAARPMPSLAHSKAIPNLEVELNARVSPHRNMPTASQSASPIAIQGRSDQAFADREVIVAAGSLVTPQLLMLSGIGPADHLAAHGISCIADLPGVGDNLIDHPEVPITAIANGPYGYYKQGVGWRMLANGLQFKIFGSGPITSAGVEAGAFVNPLDPDGVAGDPGLLRADRLSRSRHAGPGRGYLWLHGDDGVVKPKSRGNVRLRSANPDDMPLVSPNLLKDPDDMR